MGSGGAKLYSGATADLHVAENAQESASSPRIEAHVGGLCADRDHEAVRWSVDLCGRDVDRGDETCMPWAPGGRMMPPCVIGCREMP